MNTGSRSTFFAVLCLALTMLACGLGPPVQTPASNASTREPGGAIPALVIQNPTNTVDAPADNTPVDSDLSEAEILQIVRSSLSVYPWRMNQSLLEKGTGQTSTSLMEAQSSTHGYSQSVQSYGAVTVTLESILIDSMVYVKMNGSGVAETYGLVDGQWTELPPDSPMRQLVDMGATDPARIAETFATDFASLAGESGIDELLFEAAGTEEINGIPTNIYEAKGATFTYRWWISADQRFYQSILDKAEATRTVLVEYDPGINIQPPIP